MRRPWLCLALVLLPAAAGAERARVRWRGVSVEGKAPARLQEAAAAEVAVALRPLGVAVMGQAPFDADGAARCEFAAGKPAKCAVEVVRTGDGVKAERRAEIPFVNADDLARSLALLLADTLQLEMPDVLGGALDPGGEEPELRRPDGKNRNANGNGNGNAPANGNGSAPDLANGSRADGKLVRESPPFPGAWLFVDVGAAMTVGFSGESLLYGAGVRALYAAGPMRLGGALSVVGSHDPRDGYDLTFTRLVTGPRVGAGFQFGRVDVDVTLGPAFSLLVTDARPGGRHVLPGAAAVIGGRLAVALTRFLAAQLGVDAVIAVTEENIEAGPTRVAAFGRFSLELGLGFAYRR